MEQPLLLSYVVVCLLCFVYYIVDWGDGPNFDGAKIGQKKIRNKSKKNGEKFGNL